MECSKKFVIFNKKLFCVTIIGFCLKKLKILWVIIISIHFKCVYNLNDKVHCSIIIYRGHIAQWLELQIHENKVMVYTPSCSLPPFLRDISDHLFQSSFFLNPHIFKYSERTFTVITFLNNNCLGNNIFWKERHSFNLRLRKLFKASISNKKSFKFCFSETLEYFFPFSNIYLFYYAIVIQVVLCFICFYWKINSKYYPDIKRNFPMQRNSALYPRNKI